MLRGVRLTVEWQNQPHRLKGIIVLLFESNASVMAGFGREKKQLSLQANAHSWQGNGQKSCSKIKATQNSGIPELKAVNGPLLLKSPGIPVWIHHTLHTPFSPCFTLTCDQQCRPVTTKRLCFRKQLLCARLFTEFLLELSCDLCTAAVWETVCVSSKAFWQTVPNSSVQNTA